MNEENKVIIDVAAGTGTFAAWVGMMPGHCGLVNWPMGSDPHLGNRHS